MDSATPYLKKEIPELKIITESPSELENVPNLNPFFFLFAFELYVPNGMKTSEKEAYKKRKILNT